MDVPHRDPDPQESAEWREALQTLLAAAGPERVRQIMDQLAALARDPAVGWQPARGTPYVNTIGLPAQAPFPGDTRIEARLDAYLRWNAMAMVLRAGKHSGVGGHIATYASATTLYETGYRHFFRAATPDKLPMIGPVPVRETFIDKFANGNDVATPLHYPDLYVATGFGAHGMTGAPLAARILSAMISDTPLPVLQSLLHHLLPERFILRDIKRKRTGIL